jgi:cytidyltransferase-like protein
MKKVVLVTGGFDPLHSGHIAYLNSAKELGDILVVGVNSDEWLERKKGRSFMSLDERKCIIANLAVVDNTISFNDSDNSAKDAILQVRQMYPLSTIVFANGGDRTRENIPEMDVEDDNVEFIFGVGGEHKMNSSSWILKEWSQPTVKRKWGEYKVLHSGDKYSVKELSFEPGKAISYQRHFHRAEHWYVVEGAICIELDHPNGDKEVRRCFEGDSFTIPSYTWHRATNVAPFVSKVIETWTGNILSEDDIERKE